MIKNSEKNACIDAMLWVGNAAHQWQTVGEFVKEARLRGCCRQLVFVPNWLRPRKSKIFLAHRHKHKDPVKGSLFGYFVVHRIEIITTEKVAQFLRKKKDTNFLWPSDLNHYSATIRRWEKKEFSPEEIKELLEYELQYKHMPNIARGEKSKKPPEEDRYVKLIKEKLEELIEEWIEADGDGGGCFPSEYSTEGEGERGCSVRKRPGSVYAVDALCAAVHDRYQVVLRRYLLSESKRSGSNQRDISLKLRQENNQSWDKWFYQRRIDKWDVQELLEQYKGPFHEAVENRFRRGWKPKSLLDPRLRGKASRYGELIVFKEPFPILERAPQAAFRGIWHIDGDRLIDQIANHTGKKALIPKIYFSNSMRTTKFTTKDALATWLAEELPITKASASQLLNKISQKAQEQLQHFSYFKLPDIGTIRLQGSKDRRKIKFSPAKSIQSVAPTQHANK